MFIPFQFGRFTVVDRIRSGGMSEVLEGQYINQDGDMVKVAIKRPLPTADNNNQLMLMFWEECSLLERVDHAIFPGFIASGMVSGCPFLAMELVHGVTLRTLTDYCISSGRKIPHMAWVLIATELAEAIAYLHSIQTIEGKPTLHGDITPSNVMLDVEGRPRLIDLGIASGISNGTIDVNIRNRDYWPPYLNRDNRKPAQDMDTYAIARVLKECLSVEPIPDHLEGFDCLQNILTNALDPSGLYNYKDARQFAQDLQSCLDLSQLEELRGLFADLVAEVRTPAWARKV